MDALLSSFLGGQNAGSFFAENLATAQDFFVSQHNQNVNESSADSNSPPPPASAKALRQLPTVTVTPEDLVDENNRECCICLEENHLKARVVRLPCAHIFHQGCIHDWLKKHCTCPICRYELETENLQYERGRQQRMASRKPRMHTYVLDRMTVKELRQMGKKLKIRMPPWVRSKEDLIDSLVQSGKIDIIAAPKPVEYILSDLRRMGVGKLRRAMEDAGVFFDPIDVVEKEDMVRIFCNSGRLVVLPEKQENSNGTESMDIIDEISDDHQPTQLKAAIPDGHDDDAEDGQVSAMDETAGAETEPQVETVEEQHGSFRLHDSAIDMFKTEADASDDENMGEAQFAPTLVATDGVQIPGIAAEHYPETVGSGAEEDVHDNVTEETSRMEDDIAIARAYDRLENSTISELRTTARRLNVDLSGCLERQEMIERIFQAGGGRPLGPSDFSQMSVSDIRAVAKAVNIDLSDCVEQETMVRKVVAAAELQPHLSGYLSALIPLVHLSVSQLKALARDWRVSLNGCLEKDDMIQRLVSARGASVAR